MPQTWSPPPSPHPMLEDIEHRRQDERESQAAATIHVQLAREAYHRGDAHQALGHLQAAIALAPTEPLSNDLGVVYFEMGLVDEARRAFIDAIAAEPDNAQPLRNLGYLALGENEFALCRSACQQLMAIEPDDPVAKELLTMLPQ